MARGISGDEAGYDFSTTWDKKCSYRHILETYGFLGAKGSYVLSRKRFYNNRFHLPFSMSPSFNVYRTANNQAETNMRQNNYNISGMAQLYLKFEAPLTETLRVTVLYEQTRSINFNSQKEVFKNYDIDQ
jgi:hypothetical protein|tara:strand:+ start:39 stop:428 length:390 start_codon:yes stop_codon:yes gene_type:complete